MENIISFFYNYSERFIRFNVDPSLAPDQVMAELENIKYFFGENSKVIISSERYVDELVQCESILYDAYVLDSDDNEVLNQAAAHIVAGELYLSKNVMKAYFKSRSRDYWG